MPCSWRSALVISGLGLCAACGGTEGDNLPEVQPICDGSADVRLVYAASTGFTGYGNPFSDKYGGTYLVIDGACNYWAGSDTLRGLRAGIIGSDVATELATELHFGQYSSAAGYREADVCLDASPSFLRDTTGTTLRYLCALDKAPPLVREAFERVRLLAEELGVSGESAWTKSTLLALRAPSMFPDSSSGGPESDWSSTLDLDAGAVTFSEVIRGTAGDAEVLVEDEPTRVLLGNLRQTELGIDPNALDLRVRDAQGRSFQVLVRDEPPEAVAAALVSVLHSR
jgi:hypothetical protein